MILILNPKESRGNPLTLPPSFLHVTLTTPYRSTIAITRLARFIADCNCLVIPEESFGSDVEGTKPILFEVGYDERKMKAALDHCRKLLGDDVTILYDKWLPYSFKNMVKDQGREVEKYQRHTLKKELMRMMDKAGYDHPFNLLEDMVFVKIRDDKSCVDFEVYH